ncbi:MAG: cellulose-binding protein, partial [Nitrospira sp.]
MLFSQPLNAGPKTMRHLLLSALIFLPSLTCLGADTVTSHRQSPLGINLSGVVDWSTEYPFVDVFRMSRRWISQADGKPWGQGEDLDLTAEGWVKSLK